jgi:multicomponent Na+:H+ antiporter subunit D
MGLPPSGGFVAKAMLLTAAVAEGQWWWAVVVLAGGLLAGGYVFVVLARAIGDPPEPLRLSAHVSRRRQAVAAAVALCAVLLGFVPLQPSDLLQIGRPAAPVADIRR